MILQSNIIEFQGMPLLQKARFRTPFNMQGAIQEFACFFYLMEGSMLSYDSRGAHVIGEKEALIKNCNNYIQHYIPREGTEECEVIAVYLYPELLKVIYKDEVPSFLLTTKIQPPKKFISNQLIEQYMNGLAIYFESPEAFDEELGILKLKELMMILLKSENHLNIRKLLSDIFTPVNVEFKQAIKQNIFNPLSMEQLAFICHMSLSKFKREFKKAFDDTPAHYIKHKRLAHAASRLLCGDDSITDIAFECGFQDITTFSSIFKEKYHITPREYRTNQIRS